MKKIKLVSFAAAALLAVAPVAASSVVANAASSVPVTVSGNSDGDSLRTNGVRAINLSLLVNNIDSIKDGANASSLNVTLNSNLGMPKVNGKVQVYKASDVSNGSLKSGAQAVNTLQKGQSYVVVATNVSLSGLGNSEEYSINGGSTVKSDQYGNITNGVTVISKEFTTLDTSLSGTPYFVQGNNSVSSGSINLAQNENSVSGIVSEIENNYKVRIDGTAKADWAHLEQDVRNSLSSASISVNSDGTFTAPASSFSVTATALATNGRTATLHVTVNPYRGTADYSANPVITYNGTKYNHSQTISLASNASFATIPVNGTVDTSAIQRAFTAQFSTSNTVGLSVNVDTSKVNTSKRGTYPVTVSATNANGHTTTLTFNIHVGSSNDKTVATKSGAAAPIYSLNGNTLTRVGTVANGSTVTAQREITINGTSYTYIGNGHYIATHNINGTYAKKTTTKKPSTSSNQTVRKTVMHNAAVYNNKGKWTKKVYKTNQVLTLNAKKVTINGKSYYKVTGENEYINPGNIDGNVRVLKHASFIYATSNRRASKKLLKKGTKLRTYGSTYKFRNGKTYYKIGKGLQFVRASSF